MGVIGSVPPSGSLVNLAGRIALNPRREEAVMDEPLRLLVYLIVFIVLIVLLLKVLAYV